MKCRISFLCALLITTALLASPKDDIRARSEQRYPQIKQLKAEGKIGETSDGLIDAVKTADDAMQKLIDAENADRKALYKIIAGEQHVSEADVAQHAATRNFEHAKKGEWLKENGKWRQK